MEETLVAHPVVYTLSQAAHDKAKEGRGQWKHTPVSLPCRPDNLAGIVEQIAISKHPTSESIRDNKALPCYYIFAFISSSHQSHVHRVQVNAFTKCFLKNTYEHFSSLISNILLN